VRHQAVDDFWELYDGLPKKIQRLADKNYELLKANPAHPSLDFKNIKGSVWSVRVGLRTTAHSPIATPMTSCGFGSVRMRSMID
jgi:hypothetical protein